MILSRSVLGPTARMSHFVLRPSCADAMANKYGRRPTELYHLRLFPSGSSSRRATPASWRPGRQKSSPTQLACCTGYSQFLCRGLVCHCLEPPWLAMRFVVGPTILLIQQR